MWKCNCGKVNQGSALVCGSCHRTNRQYSSTNNCNENDGMDLGDIITAAVVIDEVFTPTESYSDNSSSYDSGSSDE